MLHLSFHYFVREFFRVFHTSGLLYTPRKLHVVFPHILNLLKPKREKYLNLKKVYTIQFPKYSSEY